MYFDTNRSLVYIPLHEGTPFMEGETVAENTVLNKYCDVEGDYFVYSYCIVYPDPPCLNFEDIPKEDIPEWV